MPSRVRILVFLALLSGSATACIERSLIPIARPDLNAPGAWRPPAVGFGALPRPGQEFRSPVPLTSRYVLFDDGTFWLHYLAGGPATGYFGFIGAYTLRDSTVTFVWDPDSGETWVAAGTLVGDELRVRYSAIMQRAGYVDETYRRVSGGS